LKPRILISRSPESSGLYEAAVEKAGGEALSFHCPDPEMDFDGLILAGGEMSILRNLVSLIWGPVKLICPETK